MLALIYVALSMQCTSSKRVRERRCRSGEVLDKSGACGISGDWCVMFCSLPSVWWSDFVSVLG